MNANDETYIHVGQHPILVRGKDYRSGDLIQASAEEMAFFLAIGAVRRQETPVSVDSVEDEE